MESVLVLVLSCVLRVSAEFLHEDIGLTVCRDSFKEDMYGLDDEVIWYADFEKGVGVKPQPDFIDPIDYPGGYQQAVANQEVCKHNRDISLQVYKDIPLERDPPSVPLVYPKDEVELGQENVLVCFVTGFYPPPVTFTWTKNEEKVTEGIDITVPLLNKDGTFSLTSRLKFTPQQSDIYSCSVSHMSMEKPRTRIWSVNVNQPGVGPAVFCGIGLVIGLLGVAAGTFFLIKGNECR